MTRTIDADHLVRLPTLSATDTVALGTALETRAQAREPLPPNIEEARVELRGAHATVKVVLGTQVHQETNGRPLREVDRSLDSSWVAGHSVCQGWLRLPGTSAKQEAAARIDAAVYKGGVAFTQLGCREQWVESQARVDIIEDEGLEQDFDTLGAREILDSIRKFHQEYGDVQGLTAEVDDDLPGLAESMQGFRTALRYYALQVAAHARPSDPDSQELSRALLAPLSTWQSRRRAGAEAAQPEPGDEPGQVGEPEVQPGEPAGEPEVKPAEPAGDDIVG